MLKGSCACGRVRYEIAGELLGPITCCHCWRCRKHSGSSFGTTAGVKAAELAVVEGEDLLSSWESSPGVHRFFASCCGSPIYKRSDAQPDFLGFRLGTLDTDPGRSIDVHFMVGSKVPWLRLADGVPQEAGGPPFGQRDWMAPTHLLANFRPGVKTLQPLQDRLRNDAKGKVIRAAGGLVWKRTARGRRLALIRRSSHGDTWSLPKGKLKRGETWLEGALREVEEETYCRAKVVGIAGTVAYLVKGVPKVVVFLEMHLHVEAEFVPSREVDELRWCSPRQARRMLAHPEERKLVPVR